MAKDSIFEPTEVSADLDLLTKSMKRLGVEYEMFLSQQVRYLPVQRRAECEAIIRHYLKRPPRRTTDRFRFNTLVHRFRTSMERWQRRQRLFEEKGTAFGRPNAAELRRRQREIEDPNKPQILLETKASRGAASGEQLRDIYLTYRTARKARGQTVSKLKYGQFADKIGGILEKARERHQGRDVELRVTERGGKVMVTARPSSESSKARKG